MLSPILLPLATLFFMLAYVQWRYSLLYLYVRKYESGGCLWVYVYTRIMLCLVCFTGFTGCVFLVKAAYTQVGGLVFRVVGFTRFVFLVKAANLR